MNTSIPHNLYWDYEIFGKDENLKKTKMFKQSRIRLNLYKSMAN